MLKFLPIKFEEKQRELPGRLDTFILLNPLLTQDSGSFWFTAKVDVGPQSWLQKKPTKRYTQSHGTICVFGLVIPGGNNNNQKQIAIDVEIHLQGGPCGIRFTTCFSDIMGGGVSPWVVATLLFV